MQHSTTNQRIIGTSSPYRYPCTLGYPLPSPIPAVSTIIGTATQPRDRYRHTEICFGHPLGTADLGLPL
ncbi:hypothetical protein RchiOBHm_Chr5g0067681 [Rosa chinensis]|uniref:Uncharacterized protein n=1 Tax=Rosa chinensis TaxID=74649 RepID=A0A2P6QJJ1_ROSCH|nr:hypothetical protein RchiOBHm_Chr5g0067681 [Rosa chinensis]